MNHARVRPALKKGKARKHKSRQGRPEENYPETISFPEHDAPVVVLREANTLQRAQGSCATLKCLLREEGNNCCAEAACPAKQLHSRCDFGEVLVYLATFKTPDDQSL